MTETRFSHSALHVNVAASQPRYLCADGGGRHTVALAPQFDAHDLYLVGTLDELAKFVADLAGVVRELNDRELRDDDAGEYVTSSGDTFRFSDAARAPRFDGSRAPVQAVVDALEERFVNGQGGRW